MESDQSESCDPSPDESSINRNEADSNSASHESLEDSTATTRKDHIIHEALVRSVSVFYLLAALPLIALGAYGAFGAIALVGSGWALFAVFVTLVWWGIAYLLVNTGIGIWKLRGRSRVVSIVLSVLGLISIPVGTIISVFVLYVMCSGKGQKVFSPSYQHVIAQTQQLRRNNLLIFGIVTGLVLLVLAQSIIGYLLRQL